MKYGVISRKHSRHRWQVRVGWVGYTYWKGGRKGGREEGRKGLKIAHDKEWDTLSGPAPVKQVMKWNRMEWNGMDCVNDTNHSIHRKLEVDSLSLSVYLPVYLSICLSVR